MVMHFYQISIHMDMGMGCVSCDKNGDVESRYAIIVSWVEMCNFVLNCTLHWNDMKLVIKIVILNNKTK